MKISFSTLACPEYSWTEICALARDIGFDGIEIRGIGGPGDIIGPIFADNARPFSEDKIEKTIEKLKKMNLEICCLSSSGCLKFKEKTEETIEELREYAELAKKLNVHNIRVLGDLEPDPRGQVDDDLVIDSLKRIAKFVEGTNVSYLVETNGVYADTARLRKVLDAVGSPNVAALWDIHHPYRFAGEAPVDTVNNIGAYIRYVHVKDSVMDDGNIAYRMMGEGDMPIDEIIKCLEEIGFGGYVSLEWVKRWNRNLSDPGIVFPHYANYMSPYHVRHKHPLQIDKRGSGEYVWPTEKLINYTFSDILDRICEEFPQQYAFRYTTLDYTRTYPEFRNDVDNFARALVSMGVKKGDHVAIWATNVPQWYITFWATVKIGAVLVTVNTAYKIHEAEYLLRQSDTHTLVLIDKCKDSDYIEIINSLCPELAASEPGKLNAKRLPCLRNVITVESRVPGCYHWDDMEALSKKTSLETIYDMAKAVDKNDVCNMQYTSGTTGFPKGVMLTHYNVVNNGKAIGDCMNLSTADRMMIQVPMFHCFGMVLAMTASVTHGVTMSPIPAFSPRRGLDCINKEKITCFHGVPTMFIAMLGHEDFEKTDFSYMRTGIMAGSPCPAKVMQEVIDKMHMNEICITYGQTEASPACTMSKTTDSIDVRVNTVGGPIFGVECKIVDPETNEELPDNTDGEFVARGYNIMKGYYKMPESTAAAIDENGWLHTGDLARRLEDGNYKITGRIKDMIIRGGENIYPKEIEDFLYTHPKIKDVQVIGVPDKVYGEEVMACIILNEGEEITPDELREYCLKNIAKHKVPRYFDFVTEFPMNAAGKILKYKMREYGAERVREILEQANK